MWIRLYRRICEAITNFRSAIFLFCFFFCNVYCKSRWSTCLVVFHSIKSHLSEVIVTVAYCSIPCFVHLCSLVCSYIGGKLEGKKVFRGYMSKHEACEGFSRTVLVILKIFDGRMICYDLSINWYFLSSHFPWIFLRRAKFVTCNHNFDYIYIFFEMTEVYSVLLLSALWLDVEYKLVQTGNTVFWVFSWNSNFSKSGLSGRWAVCMKLEWYRVFQVSGSTEVCFQWERRLWAIRLQFHEQQN